MSGPLRRVRRAKFRAENEVRGFKRGKALNAVFPRIPGESFPTQARRYVRHTWQMFQLRLATKGHRAPPPGLTDGAP